MIYASQGQYDKARGALEQSIRTHPSYATAYENLGDVYAKLASQAYDKALQIDSANPARKEQARAGARPGRRHGDRAAGASRSRSPPRSAPRRAAPRHPPQPPRSPQAEPKPARSRRAREAGGGEAGRRRSPATPRSLETVNAWAKAWSSKDVDGYLAFYAKDFKTPGGEARADWEKARRQRISAPKSITVTVDAPKVSVAADGQAQRDLPPGLPLRRDQGGERPPRRWCWRRPTGAG